MNKVIKFSASWCGPCKVMKPQYEKFQDLVKDKEIEVVDLDVDQNHEEASKYGVRSIPVTFFIKNNEVADKISGMATADKLLDTFNVVYQN